MDGKDSGGLVGRWILGLLGGITFVVISALTWLFGVPTGPEGRIMIATGGGDGAYHELARTFRDDLDAMGVRLDLRSDLMGNDAVKALLDPNSGVHAAIVKGGYMGALTGSLASVRAKDRHDKEADALRSVGRLMYEPIWVFTRGDLPISSLRDLTGKRILAGARESGSRRVTLQILRANEIDRDNTVIAEGELTDDAKALLDGSMDAAILILPADTERIQKLLRVPGIRLMDFSAEADAYASRFPHLSKVVMYRGGVDFNPVVPSADITLLTTSTVLVARKDLHPALAGILAHAVIQSPRSGFDKAGDPVLFHKAGLFPSIADPEYKVANEVRLAYKSGELPLLLRWLGPLNKKLGLPFSMTAFANAYGVQTVLLLIPALTILLPAMRIVPMAYTWAMRRRLLIWYEELKVLERSLGVQESTEQTRDHLVELERIDEAVKKVKVPLHLADQLYDLKMHVGLVRQRLNARLAPPVRLAAE